MLLIIILWLLVQPSGFHTPSEISAVIRIEICRGILSAFKTSNSFKVLSLSEVLLSTLMTFRVEKILSSFSLETDNGKVS